MRAMTNWRNAPDVPEEERWWEVEDNMAIIEDYLVVIGCSEVTVNAMRREPWHWTGVFVDALGTLPTEEPDRIEDLQ
jgi:hypothetical protein